MKTLIAIDSFKGSLTSLEAGKAVSEGIRLAYPESENTILPIADGGEGTTEALVFALDGYFRSVSVCDPLGRTVTAQYGIVKDNIAVIEMSAAAGITLVSDDEKNPLHTTTFGVGQMIADAIKQGCRNFVIGIGGSATNDGGIGMLQALGFGILGKDGNQVCAGAEGLKDIEQITTENVIPKLSECVFNVACDVENTLCGQNGCSAVYGRQKGATDQMIVDMDKWLYDYASKVKEVFPNSDMNVSGAGAAGGLGFALMSFLNAKLESGISLVLKTVNFEKYLDDCDIVITGEGRLDSQSVFGKVPVGVATGAKKHSKSVIAFCGSIGDGAEICNNYGIDAYFSSVRKVTTLKEAMNRENAYSNLRDSVYQVFNLLKTVGLKND